MSVTWAPPVAHETVSVAFALPRRATNAVVRNRMRRRLRGLLGDIDVEPGIYLVSAQPAAATAPAAELRRDLQAALRAVASGKDT